MRIGELAERTGVSTRLLRYYGEQGLLAASRDGNGYRTYDEDAVVRVRQIRRLLGRGAEHGGHRFGAAVRARRGGPPGPLPGAGRLLHRELTAMDDRIGVLQRRRTHAGRVLVRRGRDGPLDTLDGVGPARVLTGEFRLVCQA